ncbi:class I SAM-dependent methyltransferase [Candidatus Woesearchaeota archaeon]|jgi:ubiquinone/menaquinone biosynthesis C-methylase UbiE|nr:class I SAM-dependent methyltransferase [Candidatus Woesearchaeota archaeon]MBT7367628.1 class I SAM-dependent methyltransferase [Candidatus Woesearchaeota archaeon]
MKQKFQIQVDTEHYFKNYDSMTRFISYYFQTNSIIQLKNVKTVLEIGLGNRTVNLYLKNFGFDITSCDFDKTLNPDFVGDVRNLPFKDDKFNAVLCCEVLEHIPLKDLPKALSELSRVSNKYVVVSIPYYCAYFEFFTKFSLGYFTKVFNFALSIPYFFLKPKFTGEHYWGLGIKGISKKHFRNISKKSGLKVMNEFRETLNHHHYFFIMKKV